LLTALQDLNSLSPLLE